MIEVEAIVNSRSIATDALTEHFGVTIDKDLTFKQHVSSICKKVNNQFSVMTRFGKLMSTETMLRLYKAFILRHFHYCSMVWHFSSKQDSDNWTF